MSGKRSKRGAAGQSKNSDAHEGNDVPVKNAARHGEGVTRRFTSNMALVVAGYLFDTYSHASLVVAALATLIVAVPSLFRTGRHSGCAREKRTGLRHSRIDGVSPARPARSRRAVGAGKVHAVGQRTLQGRLLALAIEITSTALSVDPTNSARLTFINCPY